MMDLFSACTCLAAVAMVVMADYYWPEFALTTFQDFSSSSYFMGMWHKLLGWQCDIVSLWHCDRCILLLEMLKMLRVCRRIHILNIVQVSLCVRYQMLILNGCCVAQRTFFRAKMQIAVFSILFVYILFFSSETFFVVFSHDVVACQLTTCKNSASVCDRSRSSRLLRKACLICSQHWLVSSTLRLWFSQIPSLEEYFSVFISSLFCEH